MSATHEVRWSVSATPVTINEGGDGGVTPRTQRHENIRKRLGGSGVSMGDLNIGDLAFKDGEHNEIGFYGALFQTFTNANPFALWDDASFIWVKNTGYKAEMTTENSEGESGIYYISTGETHNDNLHILTSGEEVIACLRPGEAWIIPCGSESNGFKMINGDSGSNILVQRLAEVY